MGKLLPRMSGGIVMRKVETKLMPTQIMIIPTIGIIRQQDYYDNKKRVRIAVAWLHLRASIIIWEGKMHE